MTLRMIHVTLTVIHVTLMVIHLTLMLSHVTLTIFYMTLNVIHLTLKAGYIKVTSFITRSEYLTFCVCCYGDNNVDRFPHRSISCIDVWIDVCNEFRKHGIDRIITKIMR